MEKWRFSRGTWQKSEAKKRWSMKQGRRAQKFILNHWWTYVIWEMLNWRQSTKSSEVELYSEMILWMTNVNDIISRLPGCDGQAADAVSADTQVKMEDAHKLCIRGSEIWMSRRLDLFFHDTNGLNHIPVSKNQSFLNVICMGFFLAGLLRERQSEKILLYYG